MIKTFERTFTDSENAYKKILEILTSIGMEVEETTSGNMRGVKINNWPGHENYEGWVIPIEKRDYVSGLFTVFVRDDVGKELIFVSKKTLSSTQRLDYDLFGFIFTNPETGEIVRNIRNTKTYPSTCTEFGFITQGKLETSDIHISKVLTCAGKNSKNITTNEETVKYTIPVGSVGLYRTNTYVSCGTIYTDGLGKEYIGVNAFLLMEK